MIATFRSKRTGEYIIHTTRTRLYNITNNDELQHALDQMGTDLEIQIEKMEISVSGLVLTQVSKLKFHYDKYNPTRGGSFLELPDWIKKKKACINIQNEDNKCFKYSVQCGVCKIYEKDHACKIHHYKNIDDNLNWDNVKFPSSNADIQKLEDNNQGKFINQCLSHKF